MFGVCLLLISYIMRVGSMEYKLTVNNTGTNARRHEQDEQHHAKIEDIAVFVLSNTDHQGLMMRDRYIMFKLTM